MPNYGTAQGVYELHPAIGSHSTITSDVVNRFIDRAEAHLDANLAHLTTLPLVCTPPILIDLAETLAVYYILRRIFTQEKENVSEWVESYRDYVDTTLEPFATGSRSLVCSGGLLIAQDLIVTGPWSNTQGYKPTMDVRPFIYQRVDPDRIRDEFDADEGGPLIGEFFI